MRREEIDIYVCPATKEKLRAESIQARGAEILDGVLVSASGHRYSISEGIPNLVFPSLLADADQKMLAYYEREAANYDRYIPLTFSTFGVDETSVRAAMVDALALNKNAKVLEIGCGTGRTAHLIAQRLGPEGKLYLQDISPALLKKAVERLKDVSTRVEYSYATGHHLPFPDNYFDACHHFGGINTFADIKRALQEMTRVTRPGGKVVVGDESMPPWLRETEFGRILMNSNPFYKHPLPLEHLPPEARNVVLRWIIGGVFYLFEYEVGTGEPTADFDFEIPGPRGGTHRTRYFGQLEGVTPEAKELAVRAATNAGKSMHRWLTEAVTETAERELKERK